MLCFSSGCILTDYLLEDISGWDLSACGEDSASFSTCFELFWDNREHVELNWVEVLDQVSP